MKYKDVLILIHSDVIQGIGVVAIYQGCVKPGQKVLVKPSLFSEAVKSNTYQVQNYSM